MLDLYTHEIPCPDDRAIRKFLWYSALHDGDILSIACDDPRRSDVTIRVEHSVLYSGARRGVYQLRFHGVAHIECTGSPLLGRDYIYDTTFLDSAALHQEQAESSKPLYHLRIRTWGGHSDCIDVIFERFSIRLEGGRVDYRPLPGLDDALVETSRIRRIQQTYADYAAQLRQNPCELDDYDLVEYHAFGLYLTASEGEPDRTADHARKVLSLPMKKHAAQAYAAYLLGLHGTADDVPTLTQLLLALPSWEYMYRRHVLDAMERLHERTRKEADHHD